jgi:hypothetical protein
MSIKRRIFISFVNPELLDERRLSIQNAIIDEIKKMGLQPEMFFFTGASASMAWSFQNAIDVMKKCIGAVVIAFPRWEAKDDTGNILMASEYAQIEGAIATTMKIPLLVVAERGIAERGMTWTGAGHYILYMPQDAKADWLKSDAFRLRFDIWTNQVNERSDVFLGYSSKARSTAQAVHLFLKERLALNVRNWEIDFAAAGIIIDEIETASKLCSGGIFLFTKDDQLEGNEMKAAPRDNVVFEAGYFAASKGRDRVLIILEEGAKLPADLGGNIYLSLKDRNDISPIESSIRDFIEKRL